MGIYSYNQPLFKTYFKIAAAHNIVLIDGKGSPRSKDEASFPKALAWQSAPDADFASDSTTFDDFTKQRSVVFVKPNYGVVVTFPDGQTDEIAVAATLTPLDGKTGRAQITRAGPQSNATLVLDGALPTAH